MQKALFALDRTPRIACEQALKARSDGELGGEEGRDKAEGITQRGRIDRGLWKHDGVLKGACACGVCPSLRVMIECEMRVAKERLVRAFAAQHRAKSGCTDGTREDQLRG